MIGFWTASFLRAERAHVALECKIPELLELAEACDVAVRWSSRSGVCHTCETVLIAGNVEYDPEPLDPPAKGDALICCCRPRGGVVLDL